MDWEEFRITCFVTILTFISIYFLCHPFRVTAHNTESKIKENKNRNGENEERLPTHVHFIGKETNKITQCRGRITNERQTRKKRRRRSGAVLHSGLYKLRQIPLILRRFCSAISSPSNRIDWIRLLYLVRFWSQFRRQIHFHFRFLYTRRPSDQRVDIFWILRINR